MPTIMVFVDGLGLGSSQPDVNPVIGGACPGLAELLARHAVPLDAGLGVPGLPQSATGQTALLTGENAPQAVGRHVEGFPGEALRQIVRRSSLYRQLAGVGRTATFANAYFVDEVSEAAAQRIQSVTTVAALDALGTVRVKRELLCNEAVYQDLTREGLRERGYDGPLVEPATAGGHLIDLAAGFDFTLFEYFQTDRAGHAMDPQAVWRALSRLDEFLEPVVACAREGRVRLLITSDHGNIEDLRTRRHTANPVPFVVLGPDSDVLTEAAHTLCDVTPAIVALLGPGGG